LNEVIEVTSKEANLFIIKYKKLDLAEYFIYSAFKANPNSIFFMDENNSDDWKILKSAYREIPI